MTPPINPQTQKEISPSYVLNLERRIEELEKQESISRGKSKHFLFYAIIICIFLLNLIMATCSFTVDGYILMDSKIGVGQSLFLFQK